MGADWCWCFENPKEAAAELDALKQAREELRKECHTLKKNIASMSAAWHRENSALSIWKAEQLAVESSWDVQAVGKLIGCKLGDPIRAQIQPAIEKLHVRIAELEADAARDLTTMAEMADKLARYEALEQAVSDILEYEERGADDGWTCWDERYNHLMEAHAALTKEETL